MFLYGYGPQIGAGLLLTLQLALCALMLAFLLGLASASARLSKSHLLARIAGGYTTLVRGVPDLVTMLILFYGIQMLLNRATEAAGMEQITIDPFGAGVITLGIIYGAYFSETLRGAFMAVPRGQLEAGYAFGMSPLQVFSRILFPQMMRFALPGIGNNWQVLLKSTALVSIIGLNDLVRVANQAGKSSTHFFFFIALTGVVYLIVTSVSMLVLKKLEQHYGRGLKRADL